MSQLFSLPSLEFLLIAGRAIALVAGLLIFAWAFRHWRRAAMRDTQRVFEQLDLVRSELLIMKEVMHHSTHRAENTQSPTGFRTEFTERRANLRADLLRGETKPQIQHEMRMPAVSGAARGYENAARMARNGATKEELIRNCGITGHEAELLVKLHGQRNAASAAEMVGRRPRAETTNSTLTNTSLKANVSPRQPAATQRQAPAAPSAQRTPERAPAKSPALPPRSRLVAVG